MYYQELINLATQKNIFARTQLIIYCTYLLAIVKENI